MIWVAVNKDGSEYVYLEEPERWKEVNRWITPGVRSGRLPKGTIKKLIGKELSWRNNPVALKE